MAWLSFLPQLLVACLLLFVPGALQARALGLRGLAAVAAGPGFSLASVAVAAVVLSKMGVAWQPLSAAAFWLVALGIVSLIGWFLRCLRLEERPTSTPFTWRGLLEPAASIMVAFGLVMVTLIRAIRQPGNFSQEYDNAFHLNAVRYILDTADASSLTIGGLTSGTATPPFYPAAWHGFVSLLVESSGQSISVATNAASFAMCLTWIIGVVFLARTLFGSSLRVTAVSALLSVSFPAFPYQLFDWGPLYPLLAAIACLPAAVALAVIALGLKNLSEDSAQRRAAVGVGAVGVGAGIGLSHPSIFVFGTLLIAIAGTTRWAERRKEISRSARRLQTAALLVVWALVIVIWSMVRPDYAASAWLPVETLGQATGEFLTNSPMMLPFAFVVSVLTVIGACVAWRGRWRWLIVAHLLTGVMFIVSAGGEENWLRIFLTGVFYRDSHRLGALLVVTALPLAILGGTWVVQRVESLVAVIWQRARHRALLSGVSTHVAVLTAVGLLVVIGLVFTQRGVVQGAVPGIRDLFTYTADSPVLNADEKRILDELPGMVPEDATIIVDPTTGASFAYALTGRRVTAPHALYLPSPEVALINKSLNDPSKRTQVCQAVNQIDARYVLDFGRVDIYSPIDHAGIRGLEPPFVKVLNQYGGARLLQIVGC